MTTNKFLITAFIIVIYTIFSLQSCSFEDYPDLNTLSEAEKEIVSQFDAVGVNHNKAMEQVYNKLSEDIKNADFSSNELLSMTVDYTKEITPLCVTSIDKSSLKLKNSIGNIDEMLIDSFVNMGFDLVINRRTVILKNTQNNSIDPFKIIQDNLSNKSQNLNTYLKSLFSITEKNNSIEEYNKKHNTLIINAFENLNNDEMEIFLCAASTAKHSFEYWHTNLHNWKRMLLKKGNKNIIRLKGNNSESIIDDPNFKKMRNDIVQWDIAGALGGAIAGSITGPGIALSALAGGVGSSTTAAVIDIFDSYGPSLWEGFKNEWNSIFDW
jgi:hypothetical protein